MNFIAEIVGSYWLALIFQTSHVISEVRAYISISGCYNDLLEYWY